MSKPKLLWHSNSPWCPTGYGTETGLFAPRLLERYDIKISAFYGLEGTVLTYDGVKVLPGLGGTYGNEAIPQHVQHFFERPDGGMLVTLMDVWVLDPELISKLDCACWVPVDHDPAPPGVLGFFRQSQAVPIAMSKFGMEQLAEFDPLYCPHGVDTNVYKPADREQARAKFGIPSDAFVVGMVAANKGNPSRKSFAQVLEAFAAFRREHENAMLYLHTDLDGTWSQGVPLTALIDSLGIPPEAIGRPDPYIVHFHPLSGAAMAEVYSMMDVLANPAAGEGFGIPVLEAQACGVPAIVSDFSAMPEVCGSGWRVAGTRTWTSQRSWQVTPHVDDIADALQQAYRRSPEQRESMSQRARAHALTYDVDVVLREHMLPALAEAQRRFAERREPMPSRLKAAA